jgi:hypothetical protein
MPASAPRVSLRLVAKIERLASGDLSFAEITRRVGARAEQLGLTRPSYQTVRVLVTAARKLRARPSTLEVAADVAFRARSPMELLDHAEGLPIRELDPYRRRLK